MEEMSTPGIGVMAHGVDQMLAEKRSATSYRREKSLMNKQNAMNLSNAMTMPSIQAHGLRMAGFNSAMVNGSGTQAAPTVSKGSADMAQTFPLDVGGISQLALLAAQKENVEANTEKVNEEKRGIEQRNDITDVANDASAQSYIETIDREISDLNTELRKLDEDSDKYQEISDRIKTLEDSKAKVQDPNFRGALGLAEGLKSGAEGSKARFDAIISYLNGSRDAAVARKQLGNGTVDALARMPVLQKRKLAQDIEHVKQLIAESESKEELNDKQVEKLTAEIESIGNQILLARLNDENFLRTMAKEAETQEERKAWEGRLDNLTDTEFRKLKYDVGAGVIKGVATGGALGGVGSLANKVLNGSNAKSLKGNIDYQQQKDKIDAQKYRTEHGTYHGTRNPDGSVSIGFPRSDDRSADQQIGDSHWKF